MTMAYLWLNFTVHYFTMTQNGLYIQFIFLGNLLTFLWLIPNTSIFSSISRQTNESPQIKERSNYKWSFAQQNSTYLSAEFAEVLANALLWKIWVEATYKYLATNFDGTSRLCSLWVDYLVLQCVWRLGKSLQIYAKKQLLTNSLKLSGKNQAKKHGPKQLNFDVIFHSNKEIFY